MSSRCRPCLGTFVKISLGGCSYLPNKFERAYAAIEEIQRLMSRHDQDSELSQINKTPVGQWIKINPKLSKVLRFGLALQRFTQGSYTLGVGASKSTLRDTDFSKPQFEIQGQKCRRLQNIKIDLGGIAKGFAVDQAVRVLKSTDKRLFGCVSAGGDLRVFGAYPQDVYIRPQNSRLKKAFQVSVKNMSVSSSEVISKRKIFYFDVRKKQFLRDSSKTFASIAAPSCMISDALTKVALLCDSKVFRSVASKFGASPLVIV